MHADVPSVDALLSPPQVLAIAKRAALTGPYSRIATESDTTSKVIYIDEHNLAHLSYEVNFFVPHPNNPSAPSFFIDANTGEILKQWEGLRFSQ